MTQEEKAKAYDEAIERSKNYYSTTDSASDIKLIGLIFPELKESDNKRMIQYFKDLAPFDKADELYEKYGFSHKDAIAWLEKQGEHANFRNKIQIGDKVTRNEDGVLVNLSQLNRVAKKQGEEKPVDKVETNLLTVERAKEISPFMRSGFENESADKVEPKFHKGDWVVYCNDDVDLITGIEENGYCINNSGYIPFVCASDVRLWTIQDAKDGDVLVSESTCGLGTWYCIFKSLDGDESMTVYCYLASDGRFETKKELCFDKDPYNTNPATKEQRDLLFQKMHDAGYEWDAEKKELKKIEQKPAWSEKYIADVFEMVGLAKIVREQENDALTRALQSAMIELAKYSVVPQIRQEWSEEDESRIGNLCHLLEEYGNQYYGCLTLQGTISWLKSLKERVHPQKTWKPSDEQMKILNEVLNFAANHESPHWNDYIFGTLNNLIRQLKKL